jgi:hypothetical protein
MSAPESHAELAIGVDVALFVIAEVQMTGVAFFESSDLLKAGHATQSRCYPDARLQSRAEEEA